MFTFLKPIGAVTLMALGILSLQLLQQSPLTGQVQLPSVLSSSCSAPQGTSSICSRCYASFCSSFDPTKVSLLCAAFCSPTSDDSDYQITSPSSQRPNSIFPLCGNNICEGNETSWCPQDCSWAASSWTWNYSSPRQTSSNQSSRISSKSSSLANPLNLTCNPVPTGMNPCSTCMQTICPRMTEAEAINLCTPICSVYASSTSSVRSSSQTSSEPVGQPGSSYIEIPTSNSQQFTLSGDGWISYGISRMHKNTIAPDDAQAGAAWQTQLPFGQYNLYMYWPQSGSISESYLMDNVPMSLNLNGSNYNLRINQRTATPAFKQTISGYGPETATYNWYYLGTFDAVKEGGMELPQTLRLFLPTGRASDAIKKASDGWVVAGNLRVYYKTPGLICGDAKCHESERTTCPTDCNETELCGNGYCDVRLGETLGLCPKDCGIPGVCGNMRCENYANETSASCPSDCQIYIGTYGGDGGTTTGGQTGGSGGAETCGNDKCEPDKGENTDSCPRDCKSEGTNGGEGGKTGGETGGKDGGEEGGTTGGQTGGETGGTTGGGDSCGNGKCEAEKGETFLTCSRDCGSYCGDKICNKQSGETTNNCPNDCSTTSSSKKSSAASSVKSREPNICGDGLCNADERDAFRFAMEGGLLCVIDCPGILQAGCSLTDKFGSTCNDSDCGVQPYISGVTTYSNNTGAAPLKDFCIGTSAVAETACVTDPYKNGALALSFHYNIDCPHGCANGVCKQSPAEQSIDQRAIKPDVSAQEESDTTPAEAEVDPTIIPVSPIETEIESQPVSVPARPSCDNRTGANTLCSLCLSSFCPFSASRADWLCSLYCTAPDLSASVTTFATVESNHNETGGFWSWLGHLTASLFRTTDSNGGADEPNMNRGPM